MGRRKRLKWVVLGLLFGLPCLLGGFALIGLKISFAVSASHLTEQLAEAKRAGMPTEPDDLGRMLAIPDSDNAVADYRRAIALRAQERDLVPKSYFEVKDHYLRGSKMQKPVAPELEGQYIQAGLAALEPSFSALTSGAQKPGLDWHREWKRLAALMAPEYAQLESITDDLIVRAVLEARSGDAGNALRDIDTCLKVSNHVGTDPVVATMYVQGQIQMRATAALTTILNESRLTEAQLKFAQDSIQNLPPQPNGRMAMAGEFVMLRTCLASNDGALEYGREVINSTMADAETKLDRPEDLPIAWLLRDANFRKLLSKP